MKMEVKVKRVAPGDQAPRPVESSSFVSGEVPEDGYIVSCNAPGSIPLYVRDSDLEKAKARREEKGRALDVVAQSWEDKNGTR